MHSDSSMQPFASASEKLTPRPLSSPSPVAFRRAADAELAANAVAAIERFEQCTAKLNEARAKFAQAEDDLGTRRMGGKGTTGQALRALERVVSLAMNAAQGAEADLIGAILGFDSSLRRQALHKPAECHWRPRGMVHGGTLWLVIPLDVQEDPGFHEDGARASDGKTATVLLRVQLSDIISVDEVVSLVDDTEGPVTLPAAEQRKRTLARRVYYATEGDTSTGRSKPGQSLEDYLQELAEDMSGDPEADDICVWHGPRLVGMVRCEDGEPRVCNIVDDEAVWQGKAPC